MLKCTHELNFNFALEEHLRTQLKAKFKIDYILCLMSTFKMAHDDEQKFTPGQPTKTYRPQYTTLLKDQGLGRDVNRVAVLAGGNIFATAANDSCVRIYTTETTGEPLEVFRGHASRVTGLAALGGDLLASVGEDKKVITWLAGVDGVRRRQLTALQTGEALTCVALLSGARFLAGTVSGKLVSFEHTDGLELRCDQAAMRAHQKRVQDVAVLGDRVVTASESRTVRVWHAVSLELLRSLQHCAPVVRVALSNSYIACAQDNGELRVYSNAHTIDPVTAVRGHHRGGAALIIVDDRLLVACGGDRVTFTDIATTHAVASVDSMLAWCRDAAILPDSRLLVCGGSADACAAIIKVPDKVECILQDHCAELYPNAVTSSSTKALAVSSNQNGEVRSATGSATQKVAAIINKWADVSVTRSEVEKLDTPDIASMLSAYLIGYRTRLSEIFISLQKCLEQLFEDNGIDGAAFVQVTPNDCLVFCNLIYSTLKEDSDVGERFGYSIKIKAFISILQERRSIF